MEGKSEYVIPMQPFLRYQIGQAHFRSVNEAAISQIYDFKTDIGKKIAVTGVPDACVDIQLYESFDHKKYGIRVIGPNKNVSPSYIEFEGGYHYIGFLLKSGYPVDIDGNPSERLFDRILNIEDGKYFIPDLLNSAFNDANSKDKIISWLSSHVCERDSEKDLMCRYLIEYMMTYTGELHLDKLAKEVGYTPYYMNKVFHEKIGQPIMKYYSTIRFQRILNRFSATSQNENCRPEYSEWACEFGYSDQAHMIRHFKQCMGITPHQYWLLLSKK